MFKPLQSIGKQSGQWKTDVLNSEERYSGLSNFGNTCYCNSILQSLYFCKSFREKVLENQNSSNSNLNAKESSLLEHLRDLFMKIKYQKKSLGVLQPKQFIMKLKQENELFRGNMQQDAHEFLMFLLHSIKETIKQPDKEQDENWVDFIFKGVYTNETRCLSCESITSRDEDFCDLSIEIEQNSSLTHCLDKFSAKEALCHRNKYFCDNCQSLQEAERRILLSKLPPVLVFHLKRFKYSEKLQRFIKLNSRVSFPFELRLNNTNSPEESHKLYELISTVVHIGSGIQQGHYVAFIKSQDQWICFDDDLVQPVSDNYISHLYGLSNNEANLASTETGYLLFYQQTQH